VIWPEVRGREVVYARSGGVCELCGVRRAESWSHRVARSRGGLWQPSNGLHLCGPPTGCHGWLEDNPTYAGEGGWHIRRRHLAVPADIPAYLRGVPGEPGWHLIDDLGGRFLVDPADYGLPPVPAHFPHSVRPLHPVPWVDPR
jgi:hypothetical protein